MNEQELRALVREAIERHLGRAADGGFLSVDAPAEMAGARPGHSSHFLLRVVAGSAVDEGVCLIEPAVVCNHCGFCQSYGH